MHHIFVKDGYFNLFGLHKHIWVIQTFSLPGQVPAPSSPEKRESSVAYNELASKLRTSSTLFAASTSQKVNFSFNKNNQIYENDAQPFPVN